MTFSSIDQNSNGLWDTVPKLAALARHGFKGRHFLEDVDIAFTRQGALAGEPLEMLPERFYRGSVSDWGAALFYTDFLGKQPLDVAELQNYLGMTPAALSRRLGCTVDALYDRWSPSDNWQLVGPSYADDGGHRVIGDLSFTEVSHILEQIITHAKEDIYARFPERSARGRADEWLNNSFGLLEAHRHNRSRESLMDFYAAWLGLDLGADMPDLGTTSELFAWTEENSGRHQLLSMFITDYEGMAGLYNQALLEAGSLLHPLKTEQGELPFFAGFRKNGVMTRHPAFWNDGVLSAGGLSWKLSENMADWPWERMGGDGVVAVAGKAVVLVNQVRAPKGTCLALPHLGSMYMPAAHAFARLLRKEKGYSVGFPVLRVRFHFPDQWRGNKTIVRPPQYLADLLGLQETTAGELGARVLEAGRKASAQLSMLSEPKGRERIFADMFHVPMERIAEMQACKRSLSENGAPPSEIRNLWDKIKAEEVKLLEDKAKWIVDMIRLRDLDFFDSRGAILPWSLAIGGWDFYEKVLDNSEISEETEQDNYNEQCT